MELLCQNIKVPSNALFQIRKSSSSVYANIQEANYGQSKADMLSKFEIVSNNVARQKVGYNCYSIQTALMKNI